jgi:tRNA nucleotidyltransferase (CCA-adding enzyme)
MFGRVSGERLRAEIELLLKEKKPINAVKRMKSLDELRFINPKIRFGLAEERLCGSIEKMTTLYGDYFLEERPIDLWLVYFMAMIDRLVLSDTLKVCDRFVMSRSDRGRIISVKKSGKKAAVLLSKEKNIMPSEIYRALEPLSNEALFFITAKCGVSRANRRVSDFLSKRKGTRLLIRGADLKRLGAKPGPCFTEILRKTLDAKIDGRFSTKKDELSFAKWR